MVITTYKGRLIVIYSIVTFLLMLGLYLVLYNIAIKKINVFTDDLLLQMAKEKSAEIKNDPEKYPITEVIDVLGKTYLKVIKIETGILLKSFEITQKESYLRPEVIQEVRQKGRAYETIKTPEGNLRVLFFPVDEKRIIQLTSSLNTQENLLEQAQYLFMGIVAGSLFLSFIIGWILAGKAVKPIIEITEETHAIANRNLKGRLNIRYTGIEFSNLSLVFNSILDRIEQFMENQKRFTADVSHEIRSPLTAIKGNIEVTLRRKRSPEEYEETLKNNLEEIDRIIFIVNNLLFLTKVETGVMELNLREFNLGQLLGRIVANKKHMISEKRINIETELDDILFYGDEVLINQLFSNLLDNALRYTPNEGNISINVTKADTGLAVSVKDTGVGIPQNEIEKIFERFYRVRQNLNMHGMGSGLGLYMCRWIAEAHGGKITVESELDKGSTFYIYLPFIKSNTP